MMTRTRHVKAHAVRVKLTKLLKNAQLSTLIADESDRMRATFLDDQTVVRRYHHPCTR